MRCWRVCGKGPPPSNLTRSKHRTPCLLRTFPLPARFLPQVRRVQEKGRLRGAMMGCSTAASTGQALVGWDDTCYLEPVTFCLSQAAVGVTGLKYKVVFCIKWKRGCRVARFCLRREGISGDKCGKGSSLYTCLSSVAFPLYHYIGYP